MMHKFLGNIVVLYIFVSSYHFYYDSNSFNLNPDLGAFSTHNGNGKTPMFGAFCFMKKYWKNTSLKDLPNEIWKDIPDFVGKYAASNYGRIKSLQKYVKRRGGGFNLNKARILKQNPKKNRGGYLAITLHSNGEGFDKVAHRCVAAAFLPNPKNHPVINHKNFNKKDNRPENLEWCTTLHNVQHTISNGRFKNGAGEKNIKSILTEAGVIYIRQSYAKCNNNKEKQKKKQEFIKKFKIAPTTLDKVIYRTTWIHLK